MGTRDRNDRPGFPPVSPPPEPAPAAPPPSGPTPEQTLRRLRRISAPGRGQVAPSPGPEAYPAYRTPRRGAGSAGRSQAPPSDGPSGKTRFPTLALAVLLLLILAGAAAMVLSAGVDSDAERETFDPTETRADAPALLTESHLAAIGPALDATAATIGQDPALWQVYVSTDLANVTVQVPDNPGELDEYTWMDGELSRPSAREMFVPDTDDPEDYLFTRAEVSTETMARAIATVPELDPVTSGDDVQIYPTGASLAYDMVEEDLTITVHASENVVDSEHRWVITFDLNGELVSSFETVTEELTRFD